MGKAKLPPGCGLDLDQPLKHNPYQAAFMEARRMRFCLKCKKIGKTGNDGRFVCASCKETFISNLAAPRLFQYFMLRAGRRSGKSKIGAYAVREELLIPGSLWWIAGPTFKILHDATMPTFLRLVPPNWVRNWNQDNLHLELINNSVVQFRSLDDPERGRGQGLNGIWIDEAAFIVKRAWEVVRPSLAENAGIAITTTSPAGFDWSYYEFMKKALVDKEPGYWAARFKTLDNPLFRENETLRREIENARRTMTPEAFAAEFEGEDVNFTGAIYGHDLVDSHILHDDDAIRKFIPEWRGHIGNIDPSRLFIIGLDPGIDHPFGAVLVVATEKGLVVIAEYLERLKALSQHYPQIAMRFGTGRLANVRWAAGKNEAALRLEFGLQQIGVIPAEYKHEIGIQRVQAWLYANQLYFAYTCPRTIEQMKAYRYAENVLADGQKREKEQVFKLNDELPDCLRYAMMAWPDLPKPVDPELTPRQQSRWDAMDERTRLDIERMRDFEKDSKRDVLEEGEEGYPIGDFFQPIGQFW